MAQMISLLQSKQFACGVPRHCVEPVSPARCIVCHEDLTASTPFKHVYKCKQRQSEARAAQLWGEYLDSLPDTWNYMTHHLAHQPCRHPDLTELTSIERQKHFSKTHWSTKKVFYCGFGDCSSDQAAQVRFADRAEFNQHVWWEHGVSMRRWPCIDGFVDGQSEASGVLRQTLQPCVSGGLVFVSLLSCKETINSIFVIEVSQFLVDVNLGYLIDQ